MVSNLSKLLKLVREGKPISPKFQAKLLSDVTITESIKKKVAMYMRGDKRLSTKKLEQDLLSIRKKKKQRGGGHGGVIEYVVSGLSYTQSNGSLVNIGSVVMSYVHDPSTSQALSSPESPGTPDQYPSSPFTYSETQNTPQQFNIEENNAVILGSVLPDAVKDYVLTDSPVFYNANSSPNSSAFQTASSQRQNSPSLVTRDEQTPIKRQDSPFAAMEIPFSIGSLKREVPQIIRKDIEFDPASFSSISGYICEYLSRGGNGVVYKLTKAGSESLVLKTFALQPNSGKIKKMLASTTAFHTYIKTLNSQREIVDYSTTCPAGNTFVSQGESIPLSRWFLAQGTTPAYTMPYYKKGSLTDYVKNNDIEAIHQILTKTVALLPHNYTIKTTYRWHFVHCDMKLDNVLVDVQDKPVLHDMDTVVVYQDPLGVIFREKRIIERLAGADFTPLFANPLYVYIITSLVQGTETDFLGPWDIYIRMSGGRNNPIIEKFKDTIKGLMPANFPVPLQGKLHGILQFCDMYSLGASAIMMSLTKSEKGKENSKYAFLYSCGKALVHDAFQNIRRVMQPRTGWGGRKGKKGGAGTRVSSTTASSFKRTSTAVPSMNDSGLYPVPAFPRRQDAVQRVPDQYSSYQPQVILDNFSRIAPRTDLTVQGVRTETYQDISTNIGDAQELKTFIDSLTGDIGEAQAQAEAIGKVKCCIVPYTRIEEFHPALDDDESEEYKRAHPY